MQMQPIESSLPSELESMEPQTKSCLQVRLQWQESTLDVRHFEKPKKVTMGSHPLNDLCHAHAAFPDRNLPLAVPLEGGFGIFFTADMQGEVFHRGDKVRTLESLRKEARPTKVEGLQGYLYPLEEEERLQLYADDVTIDFKFVMPHQPGKEPGEHARWNTMFWRITAFSAIAHFALILSFQMVPTGTQASMFQPKSRFSRLIIPPIARPPKKDPKFRLKDPPKERIKKRTRHSSKTQQTDNNQRSAAVDRRRVQKSGMLGALQQSMGGGGSLFGRLTNNAYLKMLGASQSGAGPQSGLVWGSGRCFGPCGGGASGSGGLYAGPGSWGTGTKGSKYSRRNVRVTGSPTRKGLIQPVPGAVHLVGTLTKAEIARVIRMHWIQIKFCYERRLRDKPRLAGKLALRWVISSVGTVQTVSVKQTTVNDERLEGCIMRRIQRWRFPKPRGNGIVVVSYPFIFHTPK